jgi:hypothetical protein
MTFDQMGRRRRGAEHYLARYWRGELSLAHSFWLTNVVLDLLLSGVQQFLLHRQELSPNPLRAYRIYTGFLFVHLFLFGPWQAVGLWRAARRHIALTGCSLWARCSQGVVALGVIVTLMTVPYWLPIYVEMARIATNASDYRYTLALSDDGNTLHVEGGIGIGLAKAITKELSQHPGVEIIGLNSRGGLLTEAEKVQKLIEQRGLSTYAVGQCQSACANIFLAGAQRLLQKDAELGFHRGQIVGMPDVVARQLNEQSRNYMLAHGVAPAFVEKAMGTPAYEMWTPTTEQLVQARVVTEIVDGSRVATRPVFLNIAGTAGAQAEASTRTVVAFPNGQGGVSLELPGFQPDTNETKADGRRYFKASHPETGVIVSVTLERGPRPASRDGCVAHLAKLKVGPFVVRGHDITFESSAPTPRLEYTIAETQGIQVEQKNVRTCLSQGNLYADIHLSKVLYTPADQPLFEAVLNTLHTLQSPVPSAGQPTSANRPSSLDLFRKGSAYYLRRQYTESIPFYQQAVNLEKAAPQLEKSVWRVLVDNLGMAYGMTGHLTEAKETFDYGLSIDPEYGMFHYNLACTYAEMGSREEAKQSLALAFRDRHNHNPGEAGLPDPRRDSSFQRLMREPDFRAFVEQLMGMST